MTSIPPPIWYGLSGDDALAILESNGQSGLTDAEAKARFARFGPNQLAKAHRRSWLALVVAQFKSPLIYLLLAAAVVALAMSHAQDAAVIFAVVLLNALLGAFQEGRAEQSLAALRVLSTQRARVVRGGTEAMVPSAELVPGDLLLLNAGDLVAADARLLEVASLQVAEAALTGESVPVPKQVETLGADVPLADRSNMAYAGTHISAGRARAVVVATGPSTEVGHIAALAQTAEPPRTPLEQRVDAFGRAIMWVAGALFALVMAVGLLRGVRLPEISMVAISQVVGLVPEGLPVAMTIALAVGVQRMARRKAIVRRLAAVETLGSTSVICSDKTGTLTRNEMTVVSLWQHGRTAIEVTGVGYSPTGEFLSEGQRFDPLKDDDVRELLTAALLCNDAQLVAPTGSQTGWSGVGDPTEVALVTAAVKAGLVSDALRKREPRRAELPFDSATKLMATQHGEGERSWVLVKGAPEEVLGLCSQVRTGGQVAALDPSVHQRVVSEAQTMADRALRLLAFAVVEGAVLRGDRGYEPLRGRGVFLGLVGQMDPPRREVADAVARCREAGIRPVMVTGDHKRTGLAVARMLGIAQPGDLALDGRELEALSEEALMDRLERVSVFARVHPSQKLRIVEAYQRRGEVVAMTGDGVNDAPALGRADVGVAMGITGTDVAKESAKIVLTDDNFATLVAAVEEGRVVYRNLKKIITLFLATSFAEVIVLLLAMMFGYPAPFAAVQILWNNLVTEGLITVNLAMEPPEGDEMRASPTPRGEALLSRGMLVRVVLMTLAIVVSALGWYLYRLHSGVPFEDARTETFTLLAVCEWFNVLNCQSARRSAFRRDLFQNRWLWGGLLLANALQLLVIYCAPLGRIFHTTPIALDHALAIGVVASLVLWVEEGRKWWIRRRT